jgi:hypothetical protein
MDTRGRSCVRMRSRAGADDARICGMCASFAARSLRKAIHRWKAHTVDVYMMHACVYIHARLATHMNGSPMRARRTHAATSAPLCARTCACVFPRRLMRAPSVGVDRGLVGPQAFDGASRFNQNLAAWNVVSVTWLSSVFSSTGLSGCNQNKLYAAWGTTLRSAYPTFVAAPCVAVSSFAPMNLQLSSAGTVTIRGLGFSSIDPSPSAYLSGQPCRTTTWTTATQLVCAAPSPILATGARSARPFRPSRGRSTTVASCRCSTRDVGQGCHNHRVRGLHLRRCAATISRVTICIRVGFAMQCRW